MWACFSHIYTFTGECYVSVYHGMDVRWRMRALGFGKTTKVTPISEEKAMETGADIFGELFLYFFGVVVYIAYESYQKGLKQKHESSQDATLGALEGRITDLALIVEEQDTKIRELTRLVHSIPAATKMVDLKSGTVLEVKQ